MHPNKSQQGLPAGPPGMAQNGPYGMQPPPPGNYPQYNSYASGMPQAPGAINNMPRASSSPYMSPTSMPYQRPPMTNATGAIVNGGVHSTAPPSNGLPSRLGPQGQSMSRSMSSPPGSGPIAVAPIPGQPPSTRPSGPPLGPGFSQQLHPSNLGNTYPPAMSTASVNQTPSTSQRPPTGRPGDLPMPYHGQAQYSHQVPPTFDTGLTPGSEPVSQKSSRAPSPVPAQQYDALEGQFTPMSSHAPVNTASPPHMGAPMRPMSSPHPGSTPPPPPQTSVYGQPGVYPVGGQQIRPGMPPPPMSQPNMPISNTSVGQFISQPSGLGPRPAYPVPRSSQAQPGFNSGIASPPLPPSSQPGMMQPGLPPPRMPSTIQPGLPPSSMSSLPGYQPPPGHNLQPGPPPTGPTPESAGSRLTANRYPQMPSQPPPSSSAEHRSQPPPPGYPAGQQPPAYQPPQQPGTQPGPQPWGYQQPPQGQPPQQQPGAYPPQGGYKGDGSALADNFSAMSLQRDVTRPLNLLQETRLIPLDGVETPIPGLPSDYKNVNCSPDIFRCTLHAIPNTQSLLNKSRLPLGVLIHPFKDLTDEWGSNEEQLPVIQSSVIVRCRSCRSYINPFVSFVDSRRWKCNLCYRNNELPDEFSYDPVSKSYGEPTRRPEIKSSTIEFIAPSEYMLRPPQAAEYLFVLDVSFNAVSSGYLRLFCDTLLDELDRIPGDSRTQIGFLTFDSTLQFYNLQEGLSQPQMLAVSDIDDVFLPLPEGLMVNLKESKELVVNLLQNLPDMFTDTTQTASALGAALQAAFKMMSATGGRVSVFQTILPTVGPGALKNREDPNERSGSKVQHLGPATDFYKKLALDCSAQQVAVDLFMLNAQYADIASIAGISKYSGGCVHYFPGLHAQSNAVEAERFEKTLRRYLTRKIGFEAVMRIRCSRGINLHTFHGNFFVRSTDLLSLPNINPDAGFGMQMSIEDTIETNYFSFQAALLYTSSKGERRIRVHTLCMPVTSSLTDMFAGADQQAIVALLSKMAVDRSLSHNMGDARDALVNSAVDMLTAYGATLTSAQRLGQLPCPFTLRLVPAYLLALLKYTAFRTGTSTRLDERVHALEQCKNLPHKLLLQEVYPDLYPLHMLDDKHAISRGDQVICIPPLLHLSSANLDRHGAYLLDTHSHLYMWVGASVSDQFCQEVFDVSNFQQVPDGLNELPELDNETSDRIRTFINYISDQKPCAPAFIVIREDSPLRGCFLSRMVEDRSEATFSYYEFLQHVQKAIK